MRESFGGLLIIGLALVVIVLLPLMLLRPSAPLPPLEVTGREVYVDGIRDAGEFRRGHTPLVCVVVEVSGRWRVLRSPDVECHLWVGPLAPVPPEVQGFADATCGTVDVWLPPGERVRAAHPCDTIVYRVPDPAPAVSL